MLETMSTKDLESVLRQPNPPEITPRLTELEATFLLILSLLVKRAFFY